MEEVAATSKVHSMDASVVPLLSTEEGGPKNPCDKRLKEHWGGILQQELLHSMSCPVFTNAVHLRTSLLRAWHVHTSESLNEELSAFLTDSFLDTILFYVWAVDLM